MVEGSLGQFLVQRLRTQACPLLDLKHWLKSHDNKNNLAGLQNLISVSMAKYKELSDKDAGAKLPPAKKQKLSAADDSDTKSPKRAAVKAPPAKTTVKGPQLFGVRTQHYAKNPFFQYADKTPTNLTGNFSKEMWNDILNKMESSLMRKQYKVATKLLSALLNSTLINSKSRK